MEQCLIQTQVFPSNKKGDDEYEYNIDEIQDYNEMVAEDDEDYNTTE